MNNWKDREWFLNKTTRKRLVKFLSCVVVFCTTYALVLPAITQEVQAYCHVPEHHHTLECYQTIQTCSKHEHTHDDFCYDENGNLICTQEEHSHDDSCYEKQLNCDQIEHTHSLICYSNPDADLETLEDWQEDTKRALFTDDEQHQRDTRQKITAIAAAQVGNKASHDNYQVAEDGKTRIGITRYGQWDDDPYQENWSSSFVRYVLHFAQADEAAKDAPKDLYDWMTKLSDSQQLLTIDNAESGDVLFVLDQKDTTIAKAAIIEQEDENELVAIGQDAKDEVARQTYNRNDPLLHSIYKPVETSKGAFEENTPEDTKNVSESPAADEEADNSKTPYNQNANPKSSDDEIKDSELALFDSTQKDSEFEDDKSNTFLKNNEKNDMKQTDVNNGNGVETSNSAKDQNQKDLDEKTSGAANSSSSSQSGKDSNHSTASKPNDSADAAKSSTSSKSSLNNTTQSGSDKNGSKNSTTSQEDKDESSKDGDLKNSNSQSANQTNHSDQNQADDEDLAAGKQNANLQTVEKDPGQTQAEAIADDGTIVQAKWNPGTFDEDTVVFQAKVKQTDPTVEKQVLANLQVEDADQYQAITYDLTFYRRGENAELEEIEPNGTVLVTFGFTQDIKHVDSIYHYPATKRLEKMNLEQVNNSADENEASQTKQTQSRIPAAPKDKPSSSNAPTSLDQEDSPKASANSNEKASQASDASKDQDSNASNLESNQDSKPESNKPSSDSKPDSDTDSDLQSTNSPATMGDGTTGENSNSKSQPDSEQNTDIDPIDTKESEPNQAADSSKESQTNPDQTSSVKSTAKQVDQTVTNPTDSSPVSNQAANEIRTSITAALKQSLQTKSVQTNSQVEDESKDKVIDSTNIHDSTSNNLSTTTSTSNTETSEPTATNSSFETELADLTSNPAIQVVQFETDSFSEYVVVLQKYNLLSGANEISQNRQNISWFGENILTGDIDNWNAADGSHKFNQPGTTVIDLNGHYIKSSGIIFSVSGGHKLIIKNSVPYSAPDTNSSENPGIKLNEHSIVYSNKGTHVNSGTTENNLRNQDYTEVRAKTKISNIGILEGGNSNAITVNGGILEIENTAVFTTGTSTTTGSIKVENSSNVTLTNSFLVGGSADGKNQTRGLHISGDSTVTINGGAISDHGGDAGLSGGGAGIYLDNSTLTLDQGVEICRNFTRNDGSERNNGGGGIQANNIATLNIKNAAITGNRTFSGNLNKLDGWATGGGIKGRNGSKINLYKDALIYGNLADNSGGGISLSDSDTTLWMNGGTIDSNIAKLNEGGGIALQAEDHTNHYDGHAQAVILSGSITNNISTTTITWGGGGVFVGETAKMILPNGALVKDNTASTYGGGLAGCSTGKIATDSNFVVNNNGALGNQNFTEEGTSDKPFDRDNSRFIGLTKEQAQDYFTCFFASVDTKFNNKEGENVDAEWYGNVDKTIINEFNGLDQLTSVYCMGLTAKNKDQASFEKSVIVTGNTSGMHGGGILVNGYLVGGNVEHIYNSDTFTMNATKAIQSQHQEILSDLDKSGFKFGLYEDSDQSALLATAESDVNGNIVFPALPIQDESNTNGTFSKKYILCELGSERQGYEMDSKQIPITVYYNKTTSNPVSITYRDENGNERTKIVYEHTITITKIEWTDKGETKVIASPSTQPSVSGGRSIWNVDLSKIEPATFVNTEVPSQTIEVVKDWSDGSENKQPITITLYRSWTDSTGTHNETVDFGDPNKNPVTLSSSNEWRYSWLNCETSKKVGNESYPYTYMVEESNGPKKGYITQVTSQTSTEPKYRTEKGWVKATTLTPGQQYILIYENNENPLFLDNSTSDGWWVISDRTQIADHFKTDDKGTKYLPTTNMTNAAIMTAENENGNIALKASKTSTYLQAHSEGNSQGLKWMSNDKSYFSINSQSDTVTIRNRSSSTPYTLTFANYCFGTSQKQSGSPSAHLYELKNIYLKDGDETITTGTVFTVHNIKYSYSLEVNKKDSETEQPLTGAEFEIWKDGKVAVDWNGSPISARASDENGKLNWNDLCLDPGTYQLVETKAPDGYKKTDKTFPISIPEPGSKLDQITYTDDETKVHANNLIINLESQEVTNELLIFELPETGGSGTELVTYSGAALILASGGLYITSRKQRRKQSQ